MIQIRAELGILHRAIYLLLDTCFASLYKFCVHTRVVENRCKTTRWHRSQAFTAVPNKGHTKKCRVPRAMASRSPLSASSRSTQSNSVSARAADLGRNGFNCLPQWGMLAALHLRQANGTLSGLGETCFACSLLHSRKNGCLHLMQGGSVRAVFSIVS